MKQVYRYLQLSKCLAKYSLKVADNTYRDGSSELNNTEASFVKDGGVSVDQRKMNAVRAYFEWMPIRQVEMDVGPNPELPISFSGNVPVWKGKQYTSRQIYAECPC